jgi:quinol monooxygenase YgiN
MSKISRYEFMSITGVAVAAFAGIPIQALFGQSITKQTKMYGLIGQITAKVGRRDKLIEILLKGVAGMPGCLSYIVSKDLENDDVIWVTEVWDSKQSHQASLSLPSVKEAISQGRPLIEEFGKQVAVEPVGGHGLESTGTQ